MTQQTGEGIHHYQTDACRGLFCIQKGRVGSLPGRYVQQTEVSGWATVREVYTTDRGVGMGHCQGGIYNRQRGQDRPLSGRCIQQREGSGWATVREVIQQTKG